jgi:hypothetical protein
MTYTIVKDEKLIEAAATSAQGRQFWTGGRLADALGHLKIHPEDVCMVRYSTGGQGGAEEEKIVLLGGPIPSRTLVDVTNHDFSYIADSFDVGEMTNLVQEWFLKDFQKEGEFELFVLSQEQLYYFNLSF